MVVKDQLNRSLKFSKIPNRIVSLVPSQTELLVDLGLEDLLVGVTKFCVHPTHIRKRKTVVGGTKTIKLEKIRALQPDLILCNKEENTREMIEELEQIAPVHISDIFNVEDCFELIIMYGNLFNRVEIANGLIENIQSQRSKFVKSIKRENRFKVAYFIWKDPWMVAGDNTFINSMLNEAGYDNVFKELNRYPDIHLTNEHLSGADYLFLSSEPYPFKENHVKQLQSLFPEKKIQIVDGEMFSWYGSRLLKSFDYFKSIQ